MNHDAGCPARDHTDAARRVRDTYELHRSADPRGCIGKWFASALADGTSDNVLYSSRKEAIRHQHHNEQYYTYIAISPGSMSICAAEVMLTVARRLYDKGFRLTDPDDARREIIKRSSWEDQLAQMAGRPSGLILPEG